MTRPWAAVPLFALIVLSLLALSTAADDKPAPAPAPASVAEIQAGHDRALIRDLTAYAAKNPRADDVDQAFMSVFDKVIEHDWFSDHEATALRYLADRPDGPVRSLAQIVSTMARAQAGDFAEALKRYQQLMSSLGKSEQEEFAAEFADSLATSASAAAEYDVARKVYQSLVDRYGDSPALKQKVKDELARLDRVGKPAPAFAAKDIKGETVRLDALKGKYVLLDFWATWCAPCVAEMPRLQAAYAKYKGQGLEIVSVSLDESKAAVADFVKARAVPWRQLHNGTCEAEVVEAFGVTTIPATFLIDPRGVISRIELRGPALDQALAKVLRPVAEAKATVRPTR
jgi:peroxiredoxin